MKLDKKVALLILNEEGLKSAEKLMEFYDTTVISNKDLVQREKIDFLYLPQLSEGFDYAFKNFRYIVAIMATGIVVRMICGSVRSKYEDPAVVVVDNQKRFSISLLSGHEGGANSLAYEVASILGCEPVVSTATESRKKLIIGIGCRKGVDADGVVRVVKIALERVGRSLDEVRHLSSCEIKLKEKGLWEAAKMLGLPILFVPTKLIDRAFYRFSSSLATKHFGLPSISESSCLVSGRFTRLILPKIAIDGVTVAISEEEI